MTGHLGDALSGLLDGELPAAEQPQARAHLAGCPTCAEEFAAVGDARTLLRALPPVDPPSGFYERLVAEPRRALAPRPGRRRAGLAALAAAAAAAAVLSLGSPRQHPTAPAVPRLVEAHATSASVGSDPLTKLAPMGIPVSFGR